MSEQTYGEERARDLVVLLRALAARITELDARGMLLQHTPELMTRLGDVRSELFHYEVRATYDTPEVAESRRVVAEARTPQEPTWQKTEWNPDEEEDGDSQ